MTFFKYIYRVIYTLGLYLTLGVLSFILVAVLEPHSEIKPRTYDDIPIYREEDVQTFHGYFDKEQMFLYVIFKEDQKNEFFLEYVIYYHEIYLKSVELETYRNGLPIFVNINKEGLAVIK